MLNRNDFLNMKKNNDKITMMTAYDYPAAKMAEAANVDMILVGDSLGNVVLGYSSTIQVTVDDMIHHGKAVKRGAKNTFTVIDMPFMSYHVSLEDSLANARDIFQKTDAQALKIEGSSEGILDVTEHLRDAGIAVVAHLELIPQTVNVLGGYKVQDKDKAARDKMHQDDIKLAERGAIGIVLECIPEDLGKLISEAIDIPTIGIGAGLDCDGQVLVYHDILQYGVDRLPKFVKPYANFNQIGEEAIAAYVSDVKQLTFPSDEYTFKG